MAGGASVDRNFKPPVQGKRIRGTGLMSDLGVPPAGNDQQGRGLRHSRFSHDQGANLTAAEPTTGYCLILPGIHTLTHARPRRTMRGEPPHAHSIVAGACSHLKDDDFVSGRANLTVRFAVNYSRLGAIDGDRCRTHGPSHCCRFPPWHPLSCSVKPGRPRTAPATSLQPWGRAHIEPSLGTRPTADANPGLLVPKPSKVSSSAHQLA